MTTKVKFPSKEISVKLFLAIEFAFLALVFAAGLFFVAPNNQVINNTLGGIGRYLVEVGVKFGLVTIIAFVQAYFIFTNVLGTPLCQLRGKFEKSRNDSHAYIVVGILGSAAAALTMAGGANLAQYAYQTCTRVAIGYAIATLGVILAARFFGVKTMDQFRDWIDMEDNDSYAILVAGIMVISMVLAMSA